MSRHNLEDMQNVGNTPEDWLIFDILCGSGGTNGDKILQRTEVPPTATAPIRTTTTTTTTISKPSTSTIIKAATTTTRKIKTLDSTGLSVTDHHSPIDLVTALRSELAALTYKRDRINTELTDVKSSLSSRETECENLRAQAARQTALISSLQSRLQAAENREQSIQTRCDSTIESIQREKRSTDDRNRELQCKLQHMENNLTDEENQKEHVKTQLYDLLRRLSTSLAMEICDNSHLSPEIVVARTEEVMIELQRSKAKINSTCDTLSSCENELLNLKSLANIEKQRLTAQLDGSNNHNHELEGRLRQYERDLQIQRDRLTESEINGEKLKEELRGFESRCHRIQNALDRLQNDRMQFLRCLSGQLNCPEPCETLIKDKLREMLCENETMHAQVHTLREQLTSEHAKLKESEQSSQCQRRTEEAHKNELEERLEKCHAEIHTLRKDHLGLSEYLQRLARALCWSECSSPPALGADTNIMAESLLERAERVTSIAEHHGHDIAMHHFHHDHSPDKSGCDHYNHHHHHHGSSKLRRERSCHDIPLKESSSVYNLQRRVRILREQVQRRDLHLELLKRKLAIIEDGARGKCVLQGERDDAVTRAKKACKQVDKLSAQLADARSQISEAKAQLAEAVEYKITSLERARKIDELNGHICDLEEEKTRLLAQFNTTKERLKASSESSQNRRCRDEALINSLREDIARFQAQLSDANHRLSHLQSFRTSVARTLHLRDLPETDLLHRLQALCSAHQEFTMLSKRLESASPLGDACSRFDDHPSTIEEEHNHTHSHTLGHTHGHGHSHGHGHTHTHGHGHNVNHTHSHTLAHNRNHGHSFAAATTTTAPHHHRHRSKSHGRPIEKRLHDDCFETDIHRHHCKSELLTSTCDDEFEFKPTKYC